MGVGEGRGEWGWGIYAQGRLKFLRGGFYSSKISCANQRFFKLKKSKYRLGVGWWGSIFEKLASHKLIFVLTFMGGDIRVALNEAS